MKGQKQKMSDVLKDVKEKVSSQHSQREINDKIENRLRELKREAIEGFSGWRMYADTEDEYAESRGITKENIQKEIYGEIVMDAINQVISRRAKRERANVENVGSLSDITEDVIEKNVDIVRAIRKHEVGRRWKETHR